MVSGFEEAIRNKFDEYAREQKGQTALPSVNFRHRTLNFQHPAKNRAAATVICVALGPRHLEAVMDRDPRFPLSQELEAKQTLLDQLRALAVEDPDFLTDCT